MRVCGKSPTKKKLNLYLEGNFLIIPKSKHNFLLLLCLKFKEPFKMLLKHNLIIVEYNETSFSF